jgi:hypothetical protein
VRDTGDGRALGLVLRREPERDKRDGQDESTTFHENPLKEW